VKLGILKRGELEIIQNSLCKISETELGENPPYEDRKLRYWNSLKI